MREKKIPFLLICTYDNIPDFDKMRAMTDREGNLIMYDYISFETA